ncbi:uncharacterized protein TNCV_1884771 [Trichonephila clavipes]|nr:uncharacterized protein TNCV_1884771 [Trichonephila clavipes]
MDAETATVLRGRAKAALTTINFIDKNDQTFDKNDRRNKGLLLSEPANIIKHIPITETAYNEAWEKLLARYDKMKQIIFSLIETFMEQPSFNNTNSHNLRNIADTSDEVIRGLKSIDTKAESRDNSSNDTFGFQPSLELTPPLTKRRILSESSKIFDLLGLLSPCTVFMKIFYQKLWLTKTDWDSPIPQQLTEDWLKFQKAFNAINYLTVPRWVILTADNTVELHGFADASSLAYAAAIYCRQKHNSKIKVQLLISKTKVAPVKQISIPRLELCGAHLLSKLFKSVLRTLKHYNFDVFAWTDSNIVLSWLSSHPRKWKTFVANKTSSIMEVLPTKHWRHVPSKENPADIASRGIDRFARRVREENRTTFQFFYYLINIAENDKEAYNLLLCIFGI